MAKARIFDLTPELQDTPLLQRPYDLRHSGVTWRLNSGVPPNEVAAWAGHSVEVLMRVYAKCMPGLEDLWIGRMNDALHLEDPHHNEGRRTADQDGEDPE
jgi:integrase